MIHNFNQPQNLKSHTIFTILGLKKINYRKGTLFFKTIKSTTTFEFSFDHHV